jgi:hypothetical protein
MGRECGMNWTDFGSSTSNEETFEDTRASGRIILK